MTRIFVIAVMLAGGCADVDTDGLPSIDAYESWYSVAAEGNAPAHGDTLRIMFANPIARTFTGSGKYREGSVIVKEIRDAANPDILDYIAIMRRLERAPPGGELEGGWLFTMTDALGGSETQGSTCWNSCHVQAPYAGAWFDWGQ